LSQSQLRARKYDSPVWNNTYLPEEAYSADWTYLHSNEQLNRETYEEVEGWKTSSFPLSGCATLQKYQQSGQTKISGLTILI